MLVKEQSFRFSVEMDVRLLPFIANRRQSTKQISESERSDADSGFILQTLSQNQVVPHFGTV